MKYHWEAVEFAERGLEINLNWTPMGEKIIKTCVFSLHISRTRAIRERNYFVEFHLNECQ